MAWNHFDKTVHDGTMRCHRNRKVTMAFWGPKNVAAETPPHQLSIMSYG